MIDINAIVNESIKAAVHLHLVEIKQQHATAMAELTQRVADLTQRVESLSSGFNDVHAQFVNSNELVRLDNQEWFWGKISNYIQRGIDEADLDTVATIAKELRLDEKIDAAVESKLEEMDLAKELNWVDNVEDALGSITLENHLDMRKLAAQVAKSMSIDDIVEAVKDELDMSELAESVKEELDMSELAESVKEELDVDDIAQKVKDELDTNWFIDQLAEVRFVAR